MKFVSLIYEFNFNFLLGVHILQSTMDMEVD